MCPPVIFSRRLKLEDMLQLDYFNLSPYHLSPISTDFIPELPLSSSFDNILVIVDKLTKYAIFIPITISVTEVETAKLFFHHIISKFGIPQQVITDRDARWRGEFWKEICNRMGMTRSLTMAYHPQDQAQEALMLGQHFQR